MNQCQICQIQSAVPSAFLTTICPLHVQASKGVKTWSEMFQQQNSYRLIIFGICEIKDISLLYSFNVEMILLHVRFVPFVFVLLCVSGTRVSCVVSLSNNRDWNGGSESSPNIYLPSRGISWTIPRMFAKLWDLQLEDLHPMRHLSQCCPT